ncbi:MAG TPA: hypothetical protein PKO35_02140 [Candidatus Atribacteria bacterium]|nr:hypothetical protein [Candidatus Atribacteria bacterium]
MKKCFSLAMFLLICLILAGCMKGHAHYTVNRNGSGDAVIKLGFNRGLVDLLYALGQKDMFESVIEEFEEDGFTVTRFVEGDYKGFEAKKHYEDFSRMMKDGNYKETLRINTEDNETDIEKGLFYDRYTIRINLNTKDSFDEYSDLISEPFLKRADFDFILTLPVKAEGHNADAVSEDGMTYTWNISMVDGNEIMLVMKVPNIGNILAMAAVGLILIGAGAFFLIRLIKRRKGA